MQQSYNPAGTRYLHARTLACLAAALLIIASPATSTPAVRAADDEACQQRPRMILTHDGEVDDMNSFIRILYYSNELDIVGIVYTSSTFHYAGDGNTIAPFRWTGLEWVGRYIDHYEEIRPNLIEHADGYPTADYLRSINKVGNITNVGEMTQVTEGSEWIKNVILDDDPRTLYIQSWGGNNTTARALLSIEEQYSSAPEWPLIVEKVNQKVVIYNILNQDDTLVGYIQPHWPGMKIIDNRVQFWSFAYPWTVRLPTPIPSPPYETVLRGPWMDANLLLGYGPLMDEYRTYRDGKPTPGDDQNNRWRPDENLNFGVHDFISEGDSPAYMYLFDFNGLRSSEDPTWGGWGGRFAPTANAWIDTTDTCDVCSTDNRRRSFPLVRWFVDLQNDFASRVAWGIADEYADANHPASVVVPAGRLNIDAKAGKRVQLVGEITDPDGDALAHSWWQYADADTYPGFVTVTPRPSDEPETVKASLVVPDDALAGQTIHVILQVTDDGSPSITRYARIVVTVVD